MFYKYSAIWLVVVIALVVASAADSPSPPSLSLREDSDEDNRAKRFELKQRAAEVGLKYKKEDTNEQLEEKLRRHYLVSFAKKQGIELPKKATADEIEAILEREKDKIKVKKEAPGKGGAAHPYQGQLKDKKKAAFKVGVEGIFKMMDTDDNGMIGRDEFLAGQMSIDTGKAADEEQMGARFDELDESWDGELSRKEADAYLLATAKELEKLSTAKGVIANEEQRQLRAAWAALKDGKVMSREEKMTMKQEL